MTIESILAQTFQRFELIVVDDASTDESATIIQSFGSRIRFLQRKTNSGICEIARSDGLALARGRYSALIDQDDLWAPEKLERQVAFMDSHPDLLLSHTAAWLIDADGIRHGIRHEGRIPPTGPCARELIDHSFITISTIMVRGRSWLEAGHASSLKSANCDLLYFFDLLQRSPGGFGFIPETLGAYRQWSGGMSKGNWKWGPEDVKGLLDLYQSRKWFGLVSRSDMRHAIARASLANAQHYYYRGYYGRAIYFIGKGWRFMPMNVLFPKWLFKTAAKKSFTVFLDGRNTHTRKAPLP